MLLIHLYLHLTCPYKILLAALLVADKHVAVLELHIQYVIYQISNLGKLSTVSMQWYDII